MLLSCPSLLFLLLLLCLSAILLLLSVCLLLMLFFLLLFLFLFLSLFLLLLWTVGTGLWGLFIYGCFLCCHLLLPGGHFPRTHLTTKFPQDSSRYMAQNQWPFTCW